MIDLVTGSPGSGKSYFMTKKIYDELLSKEKKYKHIYTNINGFDFEKANSIAQKTNFVRPLDYDDLRQYMIEEYNLNERYKKGLLDLGSDDYDTYAKKLGIYAPYQDSLLVIDEAHLIFTEAVDQVVLRFITYHRHFGLDIILATQNKNLISKKYLVCIETLYKGLPSHKRIFSHVFRYKVFAGYQEYNNNLIKTISLKLDPKIAALYNSGSNKVGKSAIATFILPLILLSFLTYLGYKYFVADTPQQSEPQKVSNVEQPNQEPNLNNIDTPKDNSSQKFYFLTCYTDSCRFKDIKYSFTEHSIFKIIKNFNCSIFLQQFHSKAISDWVIQCDPTLDEFLTTFQGSSNENAKADRSVLPITIK